MAIVRRLGGRQRCIRRAVGRERCAWRIKVAIGSTLIGRRCEFNELSPTMGDRFRCTSPDDATTGRLSGFIQIFRQVKGGKVNFVAIVYISATFSFHNKWIRTQTGGFSDARRRCSSKLLFMVVVVMVVVLILGPGSPGQIKCLAIGDARRPRERDRLSELRAHFEQKMSNI